MNDLGVKNRRQRERKVLGWALLASLLVHALVLSGRGIRPIPEPPYAAAGPAAGDTRATAGGMQAMNVISPPTPRAIPPPVPLPAEIEIDPVILDTDPAFDDASLLGERPGPIGPPGLEDGTGQGDGGAASEGQRRLIPPTPRGMIIPPAHRSLRGTTIQVWVFVNEAGKVVADSTRLDPPTRNRDFNRQLIREAALWTFRPGTRNGTPVAAWFPYTISM